MADALSRPPVVVAPSAASIVNWAALACGQANCPHMQGLVASSSLQVKQMEVEGAKLLCDISTGVLRPLVPVAQQLVVFQGHLGIRFVRCD